MATQTQTIGNGKQRELEDLKNEKKNKKNLQLGRILMYILLFTLTRKAKAGGGSVHTDVGLQWREMSRQQRRRSSSVGNIFFFAAIRLGSRMLLFWRGTVAQIFDQFRSTHSFHVLY